MNKTIRQINTLFKNVKKLKKVVMNDIANDFFVDLKNKAKEEVYVDNIEIAKIAGTSDLAIVVSNVDTKISKVDNSVFYYQPITQEAKASQTYLALQTYAPYLKELLPLKVDNINYRLIFKRISKTEYGFFASQQAIDTYLERQLPRLRNRLIKSGENPANILNRNEVDPELLVYEDLSFIVLRKELGIREEPHPVWIPTIKDITDKSYLKELVKDARKVVFENKKIVDHSRSYVKITSDIAMEISKFEKQIFNKV